MNYQGLAEQNYKRFCEKDGNDYIASEFALEIILKLIIRFKAKSILEMGLGIGSIADTVLKYSKAHNAGIEYVGTEANEFCLNALKDNVEDYNKIQLFSKLSEVKDKKFDLIVIDGYDDNIDQIQHYTKQHTIIFIEGDRAPQVKKIQEIFPNSKYVNVITMRKSKPYAHGIAKEKTYVGGGQLIFTNPTFDMKCFWFREKVSTYIKRKFRDYSK